MSPAELPMTDRPPSGPLLPFHPERPRSGLFTFERDPNAAPLLTIGDLRAMRLSDGLQGDALVEFWAEHWNKERYNLDELYPFILRAAWRMARGLLYAKGRLQPDAFLSETPAGEWEEPTPGLLADRHVASLERALVTRPVAIMPPAPPEEWTNGEKDAAFYDPASDEPFMQYLERMAMLSRRLGIETRREGRLGLTPLLDPVIARAAWPSPREIVAFESVMVDEAVQALLEHGHFGARRELLKKHGLTEEEGASAILLARRAMRSMRNGTDGDGDKAAMVARLEDLAARCRSSLDLRAELMVYKTLALVQGLTKTQATDEDVDDMVDVAGEVIAGELPEGDDDETEADG